MKTRRMEKLYAEIGLGHGEDYGEGSGSKRYDPASPRVDRKGKGKARAEDLGGFGEGKERAGEGSGQMQDDPVPMGGNGKDEEDAGES